MAGIHQDKVIITLPVSSRGIGYSFAEYLSNEGANIVIIGRNIETARAAAEKLPTKCIAKKCDISSEAERHQNGRHRYGNLRQNRCADQQCRDLPKVSFSAMTLEDWKAVIDIDLTGTFPIATHAVYKVLENRNEARL